MKAVKITPMESEACSVSINDMHTLCSGFSSRTKPIDHRFLQTIFPFIYERLIPKDIAIMHTSPHPSCNHINLHQTKHTLQAVITLSLISLALAVAGCDKNQLNAVSDEQQQNLPDSPVATDKESAAEESQLAADTPVASANQKPFQFTITTDDTSGLISPVVIQFDENAGNGVVIHPNKSKMDAQVEIDCESDGTYEFKGDTINYKCSYLQNSGTHKISLRGDISAIELCAGRVSSGQFEGRGWSHEMRRKCIINTLSRLNPIISVDSWGDIQWESMQGFANNCVLLEKIPEDAPDLSRVHNMSVMFVNAVKFNQAIDHWDVSNVTDMNGMFWHANTFNQPLEKWNVSNVTDMSRMFCEADNFNQPLEKWNVSNVTDMSFMFSWADNFNQPLEKWNVSNVTNMSRMFWRAQTFNQPLENWDVSNVTNMELMFAETRAFNQPLEKWNVSNVTNMAGMFEGTLLFNQPLEKWNVSNVTNMAMMFERTKAFNQPLEKWNVSNVTSMYWMFLHAFSFNHYPSSWIVPKNNTDFMFSGSPLEEQAKQKPLKTRKVKK